MRKLLVFLIFSFGFGQIYPVRISDKGLDPANQGAEPFNGVNWTYEIVDSVEKSIGGFVFVSLQLDSLLSPKFAYYNVKLDTNHSDTLELIYAFKNGNQWVRQTVDSSIGYYLTSYYKHPSLYLDSQDNPHIAYIYRKQDTCYLRYANKVSSTWSIQELDTIFWPVSYATIALDTNNYPCIAYSQVREIDTLWYTKYLHYNGSSWDSSVIDDGNNLSDVGPSLAIDGKNNPHIVYYQGGDAPDSLKYVYWNGTGWVFAWADEIGHMSEHGSLSLALDSTDHPHIAYCIWPGLYYSFYDGILWHTEGPIDGASYEIRLDLDSLSLPHIVYIDQMIFHPTYCYRDSVAWHLCGWVEPDTNVYTFRSVSFCLDNNSEPHVAYVGTSSDYDKMKYAKGSFVGVAEHKNGKLAKEFALQVFPNPSRGTANIAYTLLEHSEIALSIYDVAGVMVRQIKQGYLVPGYYQEKIDTKDLSSGVYFVVLKQNNERVSKKFLVVK